MAPFPWRLVRPRQFVIQSLSHADNPLSHPLHFPLPFPVQLRAAQYAIRNPSTLQRRVRVHRPDDDLQLAVHPCFLLRGGRRQRKRPCTFTVKAHILRERL